MSNNNSLIDWLYTNDLSHEMENIDEHFFLFFIENLKKISHTSIAIEWILCQSKINVLLLYNLSFVFNRPWHYTMYFSSLLNVQFNMLIRQPCNFFSSYFFFKAWIWYSSVLIRMLIRLIVFIRDETGIYSILGKIDKTTSFEETKIENDVTRMTLAPVGKINTLLCDNMFYNFYFINIISE